MLGKIRNSLSFQSTATFFGGAVFAAVVMLSFRMFDSKAAIGFLGVIIGSGVSAATSLLTVRENRKQQWALAALDKRLEVHQEAYALWRRVVFAVHKEKIAEVVIEAENWWNNNCLYLDAASRQAFRVCLDAACIHGDLLEANRGKQGGGERVRENWAKIMKPGQTLPAGVALPDLGEQELSPEHKPERE